MMVDALSVAGQQDVAPPFVGAQEQGIGSWPGDWLLIYTAYPFATQRDIEDRYKARCYVPQFTVKRAGKEVREIMFPGYCAARALQGELWEIRSAICNRRLRFGLGYVREAMDDEFQPCPAFQKQITAEFLDIELMLGVNPRVRVNREILPGQKVRIVRGPWMGLEGTVIRENDKAMFQLSVRTFNAAVMDNVSWTDFELIDD